MQKFGDRKNTRKAKKYLPTFIRKDFILINLFT